MFVGMMFGLFFIPFVTVGANAIILYFLFLRIYTEIKKYKREYEYLMGFLAACFIILLTGNFLPFWSITTAVFLSFIFVHVYIILDKKR